jgi:hypothetical protein
VNRRSFFQHVVAGASALALPEVAPALLPYRGRPWRVKILRTSWHYADLAAIHSVSVRLKVHV